jgi:hypothetical protein
MIAAVQEQALHNLIVEHVSGSTATPLPIV